MFQALTNATDELTKTDSINETAIRLLSTQAVMLAISNYDAVMGDDVAAAKRIAVIATEIGDITAGLLSMHLFGDPGKIVIESTLRLPSDTEGMEELDEVPVH